VQPQIALAGFSMPRPDLQMITQPRAGIVAERLTTQAFVKAAPQSGTAGAPATGLCVRGARPARARRQHAMARKIKQLTGAICMSCAEPSSSLPIVWLWRLRGKRRY
jgi:hypothetical protein